MVFIRPSVSFGMEEIPSQAHSNTLHFFDDELEFFKAACSSWNYDNIIKHINQHSTETIYSHLINSDALQTILLKDNGTVLLNLSKKIGPQLLIEAATKFGCDQQIIASLFQNKFALPQINSILTTSSTKKEIRDKILKFYVSSNFKKLSEFICESIQISKTQGDIERADSLLQIVIEALAYIMPHKVNYDDAQHDYINYVSSTNSKGGDQTEVISIRPSIETREK